jgi:2-polyprenyl-6-methoxyphenol hydroxylase-like FAD-dependent oxidoreductase
MSLPVIIAGGGIGGLSLAKALRRCKVPVIVLEQSQSFRKVGGGIGLWGPALKALRQIEIEDKLEGKQLVCAGYRSSSQVSRGEWLVCPDSSVLNRHTSCLCLRRGELQSALFQSTTSYDIKLDSKIVSFAQKSDSVSVYLENGSSIEGSILVAADGTNSIIAKTLFPHTVKKHCGYYYWQGIAPIASIELDTVAHQSGSVFPAYEAWHPGVRFGMVPLPNDECFWFVCSNNDIQADATRPDHQSELRGLLADRVKPFGPSVCSVVQATNPQNIYSADLLETPPLRKWSVGRVTCLGDSVHTMAPNLAQGACLAIEDALELAHQIRKIYRSKSGECVNPSIAEVSTAFEAYERNRLGRVKLVQTLVPLVHSVGAMSQPYSDYRNTFFAIFPNFIKTTVFDLTHRFALGWSYTPPNLGQGLYHRLLDAPFMAANKSLFLFHKDDVDRYCSGEVTVQRGEALLADVLATIMCLPPSTRAGQSSKVSVHITTDADGVETWKRVFSYHNEFGRKTVSQPDFEFTTRQSTLEERLVECFGPIQFHFDVTVSSPNEFKLSLSRMEVGMPLTPWVVSVPSQLCPRVVGVTTQSDSDTGWSFDVQIKGPEWADSFVGLIVRYCGVIDAYERD